MNRMLFASFLLICANPTTLYSQNLNATTELNLGIAAYDKAKYRDAIDHLERAVTLDPSTVTGHLCLARTYDNMYVDSPECGEEACAANEYLGIRAMQEFEKVLKLDPLDTEALKALGWRYSRKTKFDEAEHYYRKSLEVDPSDFEALYTLAVMQWTRSYQIRQQKRAELKVGQNKAFINSPSCMEIRSENLARVEDGMTLLKRAIELVKSYDAESYLSLLYRERADIQCGDQSAYGRDISTSLEWAHLACNTRHNPERATISCTSSRCPPSAPPPPPVGRPGACPD